jgi:hypothetical protein
MLYLLLILGLSVQFAYGQSDCTLGFKKGDTLTWDYRNPTGKASGEGELVITQISDSGYTVIQTVKGKPKLRFNGQIKKIAANEWQFKDLFNKKSWWLECDGSNDNFYLRSHMSNEGDIFIIAARNREEE